jgi:hypothetical protein
MEQRTDDGLSPYRVFSRAEWAAKRDGTPMTLQSDEVTRLRSLNDRLDIAEVEEIYLPLSRLLSLYVAATQRLFLALQNFLGTEDAKMPYIIGVAGSVAVGKSTTARVLQALLARWPNVPKVDLVTTDGFLYPNAILEREGLMEKKGFPESYDLPALLRFLTDIKAGRRPVRAPVYSHLVYDVIPNQWVEVDRPDISSSRPQRAADRLAAEGRQGDPLRVGLLRFLDLSRRRRGRAAELVRQPVPHLAGHGLPRSEIVLPPLRHPVGRRGGRDRDLDLDAHQSRQSAREHPADAPARRPDPEEGREPPGRGSGAAQVVIRQVMDTPRHDLIKLAQTA